MKFRGNPEYARQISARGYDVEIDFKADVPDDGDFLTVVDRDFSQATLSDPNKVRVTRYTVYARVLDVRDFLPGAKRPFAARFDEDAEGFAPEP